MNYPVKMGAGYALSGAAGYGFGNGIRVELEGSYRSNPLKTLSATSDFTYNGNEQNTTLMVNALYDMDVGLPVFPYIGAGVGVIWDTESKVTATKTGLFAFGPTVYDALETNSGTAASIAFQVKTGLSYPVETVPGLSLTLDYRFLAAPNRRSFSRSLLISPEGGGPAFTNGHGYATFAGEYNHAIVVGVRYAFGAPAAPMAPESAPVPASQVSRSYLVFFDWDKAVLTTRAKQIVADAAAAAGRVQVTRIEVNGYTDASGTAQYNNNLSIARAKAVMAELVKDGIPSRSIAIMGYGETHPLVPTATGVREPQNRRVEIILK